MIDSQMSDADVRGAIARFIRERAAIPKIAEIAAALQAAPGAVEASFLRMIEAHVFIPQRGSHEIYAYDPFCIGPTSFRVEADGRQWWGICGWDALGIPPALRTTGTLVAPCGDGCSEEVLIEVGLQGAATSAGEPVLHVGVPARSFWDDIYFT